MAENTDDRDGIDTNEFSDNFPLVLPLGRNDEFGATANKKAILEAGKLLQSLADYEIEAEQLVRRKTEVEERRKNVSVKVLFSKTANCAKKLVKTLGIVLDSLEESCGKAQDVKSNDQTHPVPQRDKIDGETREIVGGEQQNTPQYQKREGVLRGLFHIAGIGNHTCFVGLLELVCKFLDVPENPYKAKHEDVKECLKQVENQQEKVSELVEKACDILLEIIREPQLHRAKAAEFNFTVRQANVIIESCQKLLSHAQQVVDELITIMSTKKGLSRFARLVGFGVTCYGFFHMSPFASIVDSLASYVLPTAINPQYVGFTAACACAGYFWLSLFPSKVYAFQTDLVGLKMKHERLKLTLDGLEKRLKVAKEDVLKQSPNRANSF